MVLWYLRGKVGRLDRAVASSSLKAGTQRIVVTLAHPELPFCGSHGYLSFGLDGRLRHAEDCMSGKQPTTMMGAGLRAHKDVGLGLEGGQQVALECQQALAAGAVDVLTHHSWESTGGALSLLPAHGITAATLQPALGASPAAEGQEITELQRSATTAMAGGNLPTSNAGAGGARPGLWGGSSRRGGAEGAPGSVSLSRGRRALPPCCGSWRRGRPGGRAPLRPHPRAAGPG